MSGFMLGVGRFLLMLAVRWFLLMLAGRPFRRVVGESRLWSYRHVVIVLLSLRNSSGPSSDTSKAVVVPNLNRAFHHQPKL
jgi:hypothetical protein